MSYKGKGKAADFSGGEKRRRGGGEDNDKTGGGRRKRNREVLQLFEDQAEVDGYDSEDSYGLDIDMNDFMDEELDEGMKVNDETIKPPNLLFVKEEEMDEEEYEKMMEERFNNNPILRAYADEEKRIIERDSYLPCAKDPILWKVKCIVGRERHSAFCLMQKFVDLKSLGAKLQIVSAFAVDHVKGFIFIEAYKQCDINEASKGLAGIYASRLSTVPLNERCHLLTVRNNRSPITKGMWARMKNGKYKGDLALIIAVNDKRRVATVKLIPRIDLQAMALKYGGGVALKNTTTPAPRVISASELEEFRPLIQYRRDRDTGEMCEVLDGLLLKNGYLYKKVSIDSISCHGVVPKDEDRLKFQPSGNFESDNVEWLTQLYGETKKKRLARHGKGGEKGEGSSGSGLENSLELYNLVSIGRKDFGMIVGIEKEDSYKILKQGVEASIVLTIDGKELKNGPSDMKFTALDCHRKTISTNDTVKVLEGPLKDRQGIVKQVYRGVIFVYDENESENGGYFCAKAQMCEKIKLSFDVSYEKGGNSGFVDFEDIPSSPKSPLSPKKTWEMSENKRTFNQGGMDGMFAVGQTLRIRVGPLKGYLCNVLAVRRSDVTVKLGSQHKVLTVKPEHLSEVRGKSSSIPMSNDPGSSSFKPFDLLGGEGGSRDWTDGAGTSTAGTGWNTGGLSAESPAWPSFPPSSFTLQSESNPGDPSSFPDDEPKKNAEDASWAAATANNKTVSNGDQVGGWGKSENCWNKADIASNSWNKEVSASKDLASWENHEVRNSSDTAVAWDSGKDVVGKPTNSWGHATGNNKSVSGEENENSIETGSWEKNRSSSTADDVWDRQKTQEEHSWGKAVEAHGKGVTQEDSCCAAASKWDRNDASSGSRAEWRRSSVASEKPGEVWGSANVGWSQPPAENSDKAKGWAKGGSFSQSQTNNWNKQVSSADAGSSWNKGQGQSSWVKQESRNKQDRQPEGSSWSKQDVSSCSGHNVVEVGKQIINSSAANDFRNNKATCWNKETAQKGEHSWGKAVEAHGKSIVQEDSWGAAARKWGSNDASDGSKADWKSSSAASQKPIEVWGSSNVGYTQSQAENSDKTKGWMEDKVDSARQPGNWDREKTIGEASSGWAIGGSFSQNQTCNSDKQKVASANAGSSWNDQKGLSSWGKQEGSSWNKQDGQHGDSSLSKQDVGSLWSSRENGGSSWNNQDGNRESSGWNAPKSSAEKSGWNASKSSEEKSGWNDSRTIDRGSTKEWNHIASGKGVLNDMDGGSSWSKDVGSSSWNKTDGAQLSSGWGTSKSSQEKSGWNGGKAFDGGSATEWGGSAVGKWGSKVADGNENSSWEKKGNWNSGTSNVNQDHSWAQKSNWNSSSGNVDRDSGWGKKSSSYSGYGNAIQDSSAEGHTNTYNNREGNGNWRGDSEGRTDRGGFRGRGRGFGDRNSSDWGREGGGSSDQGGFRGRGRSDRGGFRGRGGSDRGGYRGRGGSYREGFGGGGRGQSGGWNDNNDSGEDRTLDWKNGSNNNSSWKSESGESSWNQGSSGRGRGRGWGQSGGWNNKNDSGEDRTLDWKNGSNNNSAWKSDGGESSWSQGSSGGGRGTGWGQSGGWGNKSDGGSSREGSGWGGGAGSGDAGKSGNQGKQWRKSEGGESSWSQGSSGGARATGWGQSGGWGNKSDGGGSAEGSGWGGGAGSGDAGTIENQQKPWNQSTIADGGQSSGWIGKGAEADGEPAGKSGKASGSSWEDGGGSKGGGGW